MVSAHFLEILIASFKSSAIIVFFTDLILSFRNFLHSPNNIKVSTLLQIADSSLI